MDGDSVKDYKPRPGGEPPRKDSRRSVEATARNFLPQLIETQLAKCSGCGANERRPTHLEVDHIIPWGEGGPTALGNVQALCTACHKRKGTRSQTELWQWMIDHGGCGTPKLPGSPIKQPSTSNPDGTAPRTPLIRTPDGGVFGRPGPRKKRGFSPHLGLLFASL